MPMSQQPPALEDLLLSQRSRLARLLAHEGRTLLRYETVDDLVQGVHYRALKARERFEWRGDAEFNAWLGGIARQHVADRLDYWKALRRGSRPIVRLTLSSVAGDGSVPMPAAAEKGPATLALRREQLLLITRARALLAPRDQELVRLSADGVPLEEQARRLGIRHDAAQRASHRAFERLRKVARVLAGEVPPSPPPSTPGAGKS